MREKRDPTCTNPIELTVKLRYTMTCWIIDGIWSGSVIKPAVGLELGENQMPWKVACRVQADGP